MICLDTNVVVAAINRRVPGVRERLMQALAGGEVVGIPAIVLFEIWYGIGKSARPQQNAANLEAFLALAVTPWPFEPQDAEEAGDIRAALSRVDTPIGPYDVLIAGQARRRGAMLVTAKRTRIRPRARVEDRRLGYGLNRPLRGANADQVPPRRAVATARELGMGAAG